jgi:hypothetical protein
MSNTTKWILGLGAAYLFLSTRTPVYTQQADGSYLPSTFVDQLTVMLTGAVPPPKPATAQVSIPGVINMSYTN